MAMARTPARRRRARRGSLERPINARLYRGSLLLLSLPLLVLAFSVSRPAALPPPLLPANFDGAGGAAARHRLLDALPGPRARRSGFPAGGTVVPRPARALRLAGLVRRVGRSTSPASAASGCATCGRSRVASPRDAIVVMAHRDDTGAGPGADDDASGTAALVELARGYAQTAAPATQRVRSAHTIVFLSTDGGAFGGLGALRFAERSPFHVVAMINLDAIGGNGAPRIVITGDSPRSPAASLVETAAKRILEQTGRRTRRAGLLPQLIDLGFPFTLYEQGPFVARGIPAITLTTAGERPPRRVHRPGACTRHRFADRDGPGDPRADRLARPGPRARAGNDQLRVGRRPDRPRLGDRAPAVRAAAPVSASRVVDLFAHCRRRRIPLMPAVRSLRSRLGFWLFLGLAFTLFRLLGAWPAGAPRPPNPAVASTGDWRVLALSGFGARRARRMARRAPAARAATHGRRRRAARRRRRRHCSGSQSCRCSSWQQTRSLSSSSCPSLHAWLWLPQVRGGKGPLAPSSSPLGLLGPLLVVLSLAIRAGLGFDAPWYLLELVAVGYVHLPAVAITLCGAACAAQLVAVGAGRYAPYPPAGERPQRGPLRELVRRVVLVARARRRAAQRGAGS